MSAKPLPSWLLAVLSVLFAVMVPGSVWAQTPTLLDDRDPALWLDGPSPARSTIIGSRGGALGVYGLPGTSVQSFSGQAGPSQVDVRHGVRLDGQAFDIASFAGGPARSLSFYRVNPLSRQLEPIESPASVLTQNILASCLYVSPTNNASYVFALSQGGTVNQLELQVNQGRMSLQLARTFKIGAEARTCVADDELGVAYIGAGPSIFKYNAEPGVPANNASRTNVAGPATTANVAGLALYYASDATGYLLASQGSNQIAVYRREDRNAFVTNLIVGSAAVITGIDVANYPLGDSFPMGALLAQDGNQLRLVAWDQLANSIKPPLTIDPFRNPRETGAELDSLQQSQGNASAAPAQSTAAPSAPAVIEDGSTGGSTSVSVPTPTAASLAKFGDIPVSLYTGTPNIQLPLCELKGRKLSVPISLSYHASGVKVGETSGWGRARLVAERRRRHHPHRPRSGR